MLVEGVIPLARTDSLVRWRDRLKDGLALEVDSTDSYRLKYYDSFDWRLYAAGMRLECRVDAGACRLSLVKIDDGSLVAEQTVPSDDIRFVSELPVGELKRKIAPLLDLRAFLPIVTMQVRSYCLRKDDKEGKTRARLYLESFTMKSIAGASKVLQKRLRLQPLRGYKKDSRRILRKLDKHYHLSVGDVELFENALALAGRRPGDYSSGFSVALHAGMRADEAVRAVLLDLFSAMTVNERGTIEDLDSEFLHDFRVAVRRTRSAFGELKGVFPPATLKRFKREFAWLGGLTSRVRDLDVYLIEFDRYQSALPGPLRGDLEPLRVFLQRKKLSERAQHLIPGLKGGRYRRLKTQWQRYLDSAPAKRPTAPDALISIDLVANQRIWHMYKRVMREGGAITDESQPPELHELRKSCKKLRYLMEFFQSLYSPGKIRVLIGELKQLQDNLGEFQDLDVQIAAVERFSEEMRRRGEYSAETGRSMDALLTILRTEMAAVRADFHKRFERFSKRSTRVSFKKLVDSGGLKAAE